MTPVFDENASSRAARIDDEALAWLVGRRNYRDADTERAFAAWLAVSPQHSEAYARWAEEWRALDAVPARARATLGQSPSSSVGRQRRWWLAAGCTAGAAAWLAVNTELFATSPAAPASARYATAAGELRPLVLPDGSQVELDTASSLSVAWTDTQRRLILPAGQAWFDVLEDASRPVEILAGPARVHVAGTQLTVRHLSGSLAGSVEVAVLRGQVRVAAEIAGNTWRRWWSELTDAGVTLTAGQRLQVTADGRTGVVQAADIARMALWREQRIALDDVTLADALAEFARYGHAVPRVADARAAGLRLTGIFDATQPERFYQVLPQVLPVSVREEGQGVVITSTT